MPVAVDGGEDGWVRRRPGGVEHIVGGFIEGPEHHRVLHGPQFDGPIERSGEEQRVSQVARRVRGDRGDCGLVTVEQLVYARLTMGGYVGGGKDSCGEKVTRYGHSQAPCTDDSCSMECLMIVKRTHYVRNRIRFARWQRSTPAYASSRGDGGTSKVRLDQQIEHNG